MKYLLFILIASIYSTTACSQDGIFAFANKMSTRSKSSAVDNYKFETANKVFDALVAAQGDFRQQAPSLVMSGDDRYVAWTRPGRAEIGLEELAYDLCVSFGADSLNALAALLTHELVHYYEKHDWSRHFVQETEGLNTAKKLEKLEEGLKLEAQADYLGGFLAYSAGFDVHGVMPALLQKVYSEAGYDLPAEIDGYPSLEDRISMSEQAMGRLQELQVVFEMATYLNLLEYFDDAALYYQYILRDFQSRDVYNNAGATALLAALPYFTKKEMPYGLPIELDPKSRLEKNTTRQTDQTRRKEREKRIQQALDYFDRALLLDRQYAPAFLNKAVAFVLLQDWEEANYWLRKASKEDLSEKMAADLLVLKGIIAAQQDDPEGARGWWEKASAQDSELARVNLDIIEHGSLEPKEEVYGFAATAEKEQIESLEVLDYLVNTPPDRTIEFDAKKALGYHRRPNSNIYSHLVDGGREYIIVQVVGPEFSGKSLEGLAIGDQRDLLLEKYGPAQRQIQTPTGAFLVYPNRNMFFQVKAGSGVNGWGIYRVKE